MNWDDLKYILAISRAGTLSGAAKQLGVSQPTVSRRLFTLEENRGVRLFDRTEEGYALTQAGDEIIDTLERIEEEISNLDRQVFGRDNQLTGSLRITCTEVLANNYLASHLKVFSNLHPEIDLNLLCGFQHLSLSRREADVAIRVTSGPQETLVGRHLVDLATGVYIASDHPSWKNGEPDILNLDWIGWQDEPYNRSVIQKRFPKAQIRHRVDDMHVMCAMARAGLGVVVLPCYFGDLSTGIRRAVTEPIQEKNFGLWILTHPDVRRAARVRAFTQFIGDQIVSDRALFEGATHS